MSAGPTLPPLLNDNEDLTLALFTHDSVLRQHNPEIGDVRRFQIIGRQVMEFIVTDHYFTSRPTLTHDALQREQLQGEKNRALDMDSYKYWFEQYRLRNKFVATPGITPFQDDEEIRDYFHRIIGATYYCNGIEVTKAWIIALIDPNYQSLEPPSYATSPAQSTAFLPPQPSSPPPPTPSSASTSGLLPLPMLSLVNQLAAQLRMDIRYDGESTGPPHQPTWTVKCMIQNIERGQGIGRSQKAAKEEAARQAWVNMGWGPG
uniref:DRBM domain-containing protein n=1 Tax=Moniliophthora roreri TaxID=221103 RepID=A0A0W0FAU2_MONRR